MDTSTEFPKTAILLGGRANTISAARSLGRAGVPVAVIANKNNPALKSRFVTVPLPRPEHLSAQEYYHHVLLEEDRFPRGSVVFPCEDDAIVFVATHKPTLIERYLLDIQSPGSQLDLLDKKRTLTLAKKVGCPAPQYWDINDFSDIVNCLDDIEFPVLLKPIHSHIFQKRFGPKLLLLHDSTQLLEQTKKVLDAGIAFMLCEFIPGPDTLLNSYYVYIDKNGNRLFECTKRVVRRSPPNFGGGCYHITQWLPETAEMGYRFFSGIGFRGLGNIEFKTDLRDGQLKVIECNARFTGAQELITRSGIDMPKIIYRYLTTGSKPTAVESRDFLTLWLPLADLDSYRILHAKGELTLCHWLKSIFRLHVISSFDWTDPKPFIAEAQHELKTRIKMCFHKLKARSGQ